MINGVIVKGIGGFYYVQSDRGVAECRARGKFRKAQISPMVGDKVGISIVNENPLQGAIEEIYPRKNFLIRPPVANVDTVVIVIATASPNPDYCMVDKLIVTAEKAGIEIIIAVNKTDIAKPDNIIEVYEKAGFQTISVCAEKNEGINGLRALISGKTVAFAGNSGVGKSSLLNRLGFDLETGEVSKIERGKHTTRHAELLPLDTGGYVIDTPGFSLLEVSDIKASELKDYFREFKDLGDCRFSGCVHIGAKPSDCAVSAAVGRGEICPSRYESYLSIYDSLKDIKDWEL
ncbi:MAG: putative ribosome biogenesis GTPase RsgA [Firmicutes bacterium ADurb.Bin193]|nr:MAG: putative ribosome biogenesis GTPase RsgA [Firmicutes bacterium ADurb.Bin193]